jgi:sporulation protein YlmC with PRC-barrel domain
MGAQPEIQSSADIARRDGVVGAVTNLPPMKKLRLPLLASLVLALAGALSAQSSSGQPASSPPRSESPRSGQNQRSSSDLPAGSEASKEQLKLSQDELSNEVTDANKVSKILGKEVRNAEGERVGKVKDIVVDMQQGRIAYAVLATGGLFSDGKLIAVPLDALSLKPGEEHFLIDAPKERLASAPGFSDDNWPKLNAAEGDKSIGLSASTDESTRQKAAEEQEDNPDRTTGNTTTHSTGNSTRTEPPRASGPKS